ncbi:hypothetical protein L6E12_25965 [Actinokineospora sp. PR83]|uniref:hypothetical protein n=1 Tax=Actinokineospora sp. PR83 TaxID=2884908 RepID=UPI001F47EDF4|nr:hypothetical protein [Actinokineospora sp. PR83]MCG8919232.1 hypothetical protein [Actinokineospora sp. PR83]
MTDPRMSGTHAYEPGYATPDRGTTTVPGTGAPGYGSHPGSEHATAHTPSPRTPVHPEGVPAWPTESAPAVEVDSDPNDGMSRRRDRVRWGAVWAGTAIALPVFLVLQLAFFAAGWLNVTDGHETAAAVTSGILSLVAFFIGGLAAGSSAIWRGVGEGAFHGALVWAVGLTALLLLTLVGGTALLGSAFEAAVQVGANPQPGVDEDTALRIARSSAGWGALWLALSLGAAALGGMLGAKTWPRRSRRTTTYREQAPYRDQAAY